MSASLRKFQHRLKFVFTKYIYNTAMFAHLVLTLLVPFAFVEDKPVKIFVLVPVVHFIFNFVISMKFDDHFTTFDIKNTLAVKFVLYFIPIFYYFMFRGSYRVSLLFLPIVVFTELTMYGMLFLDGKAYAYDTRTVQSVTDEYKL